MDSRYSGRSQNLVRIVAVCAFVIIVAAGVLFGPALLTVGSSRRPDLESISKITHLHFPRSTTVIRSRLDKEFQGGRMWAKIEMQETDIHTFLQSLHHPVALGANSQLPQLDAGARMNPPDWWNPYPSQGYEARVVTVYPLLAFTVSKSGSSHKAIVYILWAG